MDELIPLQYEDLIKNEIRDDIGHGGDLSTNFFIPAEKIISASIFARENGVLAGIDVALYAFKVVSDNIKIEKHLEDGSKFNAGVKIATLSGSARAILTAERTSLNILSHLCGIASMTRLMVGSA